MQAEPKILFVDDDPDILNVYEMMMDQQGFDVDFAKSGEEAIELLEADPFDCVITDLRMPDGNGLKVRDAAKAKNIPVVILTGFKGPYQDMLETSDAILEKPVRLRSSYYDRETSP